MHDEGLGMAVNARVLLAEAVAERGEDLRGALARRGCEVIRMPLDGDVVERAGRDRPHVVVVDGLPAGQATGLPQAFRAASGTRHIPLILIGGEGGQTPTGIDDVLPAGCAPDELATRVRALTRLGVMYAELERRAETIRRFGLSDLGDLAPPAPPARLRVLAVEPAAADLATLREALRGTGSVEIAASPRDAVGALTDTPHDLVVVFVGADAAPALEACSTIRRAPSLFHFPLLVVVPPDAAMDPADPYRHGASDVLQAPLQGGELRARMLAQVRQERFRAWLQRAYRQGLSMVVTDGLTGLFRYGFFHEHLDILVRDIAAKGSPLAVAHLKIANLDAINRLAGHAAGDRALRQAGAMIGRLVRAEDLAARVGGASFAIAMPETPGDAAEAVTRRIAAVLRTTDLGLEGASEPLDIVAGCASWTEGDTSATLALNARTRAM